MRRKMVMRPTDRPMKKAIRPGMTRPKRRPTRPSAKAAAALGKKGLAGGIAALKKPKPSDTGGGMRPPKRIRPPRPSDTGGGMRPPRRPRPRPRPTARPRPRPRPARRPSRRR